MSSTLWLIGVQGRSDPPDDWHPEREGCYPTKRWSPKLEGGGKTKWTGRQNQIGRLLDQTMVPCSRKQVS